MNSTDANESQKATQSANGTLSQELYENKLCISRRMFFRVQGKKRPVILSALLPRQPAGRVSVYGYGHSP